MRHRVVQHRIPMLLEVRDLFGREGQRHLLFLLERLAFGDEAVVLGPGFLIGHEMVDGLVKGFHARLIQESLAQITGLPRNRSFFNRRWHIQSSIDWAFRGHGRSANERVGSAIQHTRSGKANDCLAADGLRNSSELVLRMAE